LETEREALLLGVASVLGKVLGVKSATAMLRKGKGQNRPCIHTTNSTPAKMITAYVKQPSSHTISFAVMAEQRNKSYHLLN